MQRAPSSACLIECQKGLFLLFTSNKRDTCYPLLRNPYQLRTSSSRSDLCPHLLHMSRPTVFQGSWQYVMKLGHFHLKRKKVSLSVDVLLLLSCRCVTEPMGRTAGHGSHRDFMVVQLCLAYSSVLGTFSMEIPLVGLLILGLSLLHKCLLSIPNLKERESC